MPKSKPAEKKRVNKGGRPRKVLELYKGEEASKRLEAAFGFALQGGETPPAKPR